MLLLMPPIHGTRPLTGKAFTSKQSDDTHETSYAYPPPVPTKEGDPRSFWQKVPRPICCFMHLRSLITP
ncbi:hypothetical protein CPB84DRAFT_1786426 [Gymnopilus junonius]|uniref:Uncharacterized protein n=1 Tax=Gymnopilus junonius TaxID=109634 RepID=A0A9P5NFM2_GYMJU|nr:hypothetical protein CPB84DRAFT_1786426 [Gymnopilus junonius]